MNIIPMSPKKLERIIYVLQAFGSMTILNELERRGVITEEMKKEIVKRAKEKRIAIK